MSAPLGSDDSSQASIRAATDRDAAIVAKLWTQAYFAEGAGGRTEPYGEADFFEAADCGRVFVAESRGALVGVVALLAPGAPGRAVAQAEEAELSRLAVTASARRRGIGRALVAHCEQVARAEGWTAISLWSRAYQVAAHLLYESIGYRRVPSRDRVDGTGHARLVFLLRLDPLPE